MSEFADLLNKLVRPLTTFGFAIVLQYGFLRGLIDAQLFVPIAIMVISFWFGQRGVPPSPPNGEKK